MLDLVSPAYWFRVRDESLAAARKCREALTNPDGHWRYSANDPRVKRATASWLERAREAEARAEGKRPVIENCVVIRGADGVQGRLYAGEII